MTAASKMQDRVSELAIQTVHEPIEVYISAVSEAQKLFRADLEEAYGSGLSEDILFRIWYLVTSENSQQYQVIEGKFREIVKIVELAVSKG